MLAFCSQDVVTELRVATVTGVTAPTPRKPYPNGRSGRSLELPMTRQILILAVGLMIALALLAAALVAVTTG
jgi:hypothetical protein